MSAVATSDRFGCRLGSLTAKINALIGSKPISVATLAKKSKAKATHVRNHLRTLKGKRLVRITDDGVVVRKHSK